MNQSMQKVELSKRKLSPELGLDLEPQGQGRGTALLQVGGDDCAEFPGHRSLQAS